MAVLSRPKRFMAVFLALKRALHDRLRGSGALDPASLPRLAVLCHVRERGEAPMKDIAGLLYVTPPSATALVEGAVRAGLLKRRQDAKDRRSVLLALTPKGDRALDVGMRRVEAAMARMFGRLDAPEQERLISLLEKLFT